MASLPLTYAGLLYWDRTLALATGEVQPDGVDLTYVRFDDPGELFRRQCQHAEFPAAEMSASSYLAMISREDDRFVGIPVFPSRHFRHAQVYVNRAAGIFGPEDLRGRKVGILEYQMTAALWVRAFLQHDYGVHPRDVSWLTGGLREPDFHERMPLELPGDVSLERIPAEATLEGMLCDGDIDALVSAFPPASLERPDPPVARLFSDYRQVERDYFIRTGVFPVMHLVVLRRDVYEANRSLARVLYDAFCAAKGSGMRRLHQITGLAVSLPWLEAELDEVARLFGGDAFPYGIAANRDVLDALTRYAHEQGIAARALATEELFAPETHAT
ncbi:MAG: ABC transporter substrate-binding protein [Actinophytocola sp.]|nr:ABC transporter substrate-binding protein [Actinophytocola sp.]